MCQVHFIIQYKNNCSTSKNKQIIQNEQFIQMYQTLILGFLLLLHIIIEAYHFDCMLFENEITIAVFGDALCNFSCYGEELEALSSL